MNVSQLLEKYSIDIEHLPNQHGPNVVKILALTTEVYDVVESGRKKEKQRHMLHLAGFTLPLKLGNMRLKVLSSLLGPETDNWIGKKISIYVGQEAKFGKVEMFVMIDLRPVDQSLPEVSQARRSDQVAANPYGVGQPSTQPGPADSRQLDMSPIGLEAAAIVCCTLEERGRKWDDLRLFLNTNGYAELIAGKEPPDCPKAIKPGIEAFARSLPKVNPRPDPEKFRKLWKPPPHEHVNKETGELSRLPSASEIEDDDIPF